MTSEHQVTQQNDVIPTLSLTNHNSVMNNSISSFDIPSTETMLLSTTPSNMTLQSTIVTPYHHEESSPCNVVQQDDEGAFSPREPQFVSTTAASPGNFVKMENQNG